MWDTLDWHTAYSMADFIAIHAQQIVQCDHMFKGWLYRRKYNNKQLITSTASIMLNYLLVNLRLKLGWLCMEHG
jgi:hypothetical protein